MVPQSRRAQEPIGWVLREKRDAQHEVSIPGCQAVGSMRILF